MSSTVEYDEAQGRAFAEAMGRAVCYVYLLRKGPAWSAESTPETDALQQAHLANMRRLKEEGKLVFSGPLLDALQLGGDIRSIGVLSAGTLAEARAWIDTDPMVQARRLEGDVHAWMVDKGVLP